MKINNRFLSFLIISVVYIISATISITSFVFIQLDLWLRLLIADIIGTTVVFVFSLIFKNASVYDPYWSVQPIVILVGFAMFSQLSAIKIVLLCAVCLWGIRLTANWAYTFKNMQHQDWRYTMLCEKTKKFYPLINYLGIHMFPTLVVYLCTLPAVIVMTTNAVSPPLGYVFISFAFLAVVIQGIADCQMHYFKKHRTTENFIQIGLWKYFMHPNYFAEVLFWWAIGLCCTITLGTQYYLLAGAMVNTLMFKFVSIPMANKRQSKKQGYEQYQKQTTILNLFKKQK